MKVISDIDGLKAAVRSQSFEGDLAPIEEQTVSLAGVLGLIDKFTIEADLVRQKDALNYAYDLAAGSGDDIVISALVLPAWDGKGDQK